MKTSTTFVLLSLGAANPSTAITLRPLRRATLPRPTALAIAQPRAMTLDRLTKPKEDQKMGADQCADERENCIPVEEMLQPRVRLRPSQRQ